MSKPLTMSLLLLLAACGHAPCSEKYKKVCVIETDWEFEFPERLQWTIDWADKELGIDVAEVMDEYDATVEFVKRIDAEENRIGQYEYWGDDILIEHTWLPMPTLLHEILHLVARRVDQVSVSRNLEHRIPEYFGEGGLVERFTIEYIHEFVLVKK